MKNRVNRLLTKSEFNFLVSYECIRTDHSKINFSLILISGDKIDLRNQLFKAFLKYLFQRLRDLDIIGYYQDHCLGIILPSTDHEKAKLFVDNFIFDNAFYVKDLITIDIYTYPDQWFKKYTSATPEKLKNFNAR